VPPCACYWVVWLIYVNSAWILVRIRQQ